MKRNFMEPSIVTVTFAEDEIIRTSPTNYLPGDDFGWDEENNSERIIGY